jgi:hypothetical protein
MTMTESNTFVFGGKTYQVIPHKNDHQPPSWYAEQMQFAIDNKDYTTVKNRIINGNTLGWLKVIK